MQWTPIYWGDYLRDTAHLDLTEHGAYIKLLAHYYSTGRPLPADQDKLTRICSAFSEPEREAVQRVIAEFFIEDGGVYRNRRADQEIVKRDKVSDARRKAAKVRHHPGDANAEQMQSKSNANAKQMDHKSTTRAPAKILQGPTSEAAQPPGTPKSPPDPEPDPAGAGRGAGNQPPQPEAQANQGDGAPDHQREAGSEQNSASKAHANAMQMQNKSNANGHAKGMHPQPQPQPQNKTLFPPITPPTEAEGQTSKYPEQFEATWQARPRRAGNDPKPKALEAWKARIKKGCITAEQAHEAVIRYRAFCEATGKIGTETVMQMATFFGPKNEAYLHDWKPPTRPQANAPTASRYHGLDQRYYGETRAGVLAETLHDD